MLVVQIIGALLIYPGLLLLLALALFATLLGQSEPGDIAAWRTRLLPFARAMLRPAWWNLERLLAGTSIGLATLGLVLLPWPWNPAAPTPGLWFWAWLALEAAFLLPLLPALLASAPPIVRIAIRTAQLGLFGRALLWAGLAVGLLIHSDWQVIGANGHSPLLAHLLAALAAVLAFPAAIGWGPFAAAGDIAPGDTEEGLDQTSATFARAAATIRRAALLAASLVAILPIAPAPPLFGLFQLLAGFGAATLLLKQFDQRMPRLSLPGALRICSWRVLPFGLAAMLYLGLVTS